MGVHDHHYEQGYRSALSREEKQQFRQEFCGKSAWMGISLAFANLSIIYIAIAAGYLALVYLNLPIIAALVTLLSLIVATRQMRALENIVHFGSHNNFCQSKSLNDRTTNLLAAWPMLQDVRQYRVFHAAHHGDYGAHGDPCKERLERIGASGLEINNNRQLIYAILVWMPAYVREFYNEVKSSSKQVVIFGAWHASVIAALMFAFGWQFAAYAAVHWFVSMFLILPFLRSIAEFSEHDYQRGDTVCDTTFNNLGLLDHVLLHPAGDAWHALHHLHPTVTWWKQGQAHRFLMERDSAYRMVHNRDDLIQDIANFPVAARSAGAGNQALETGSAAYPSGFATAPAE
ncbi:MAG: fatty acid desaturase [Rhizobiaceae bacterium]